MNIESYVRRLYRTYIHLPWLDTVLYALLERITDARALWHGFSFPVNYVRRWKLDMLSGLYEPGTYALFKKVIKSGMVIVDIGAHIGYFTRLFSACVGKSGKVYAFEADPENFALLEKNTSRLRNVERVQLAVADTRGVLQFYHYDDKSGAHSTLPNVPLNYAKRELTVQATDLDSWLKQKGISRVAVIKMDIEGGESAALRGMQDTLKKAKVLVTELAPAWVEAAGSAPLQFLQSIERLGFEIFAITENGLVKLSPVRSEGFRALLPKPANGSHASEFINLYCVKKKRVTE